MNRSLRAWTALMSSGFTPEMTISIDLTLLITVMVTTRIAVSSSKNATSTVHTRGRGGAGIGWFESGGDSEGEAMADDGSAPSGAPEP